MTTARAAELVARLVSRATLDGSTAMRTSVLATALRGYGIDPAPAVELAEETGKVLTLPGEDLIAVPEVARAEQAVATEVARLLAGAEPSLSMVVGADSDESLGATVVTDAHRLQLSEAAQLLRKAGPGSHLVLAGDPDELQPIGPGRPFGDVVASGLVPVAAHPPGTSLTPHVARLVASLRSGELPPVPTDQREVVVVPCESAEQAVTRTVQLVTSSLPRLLGSVAPLVLTVREAGEAGVGALRETLADTEVVTVATAVGRRAPAVVLVLPGEAAGSLSRALLISALNVVGEHVSIVHQAGPALVSAVERRPHRPRLTRLPALLRSMC